MRQLRSARARACAAIALLALSGCMASGGSGGPSDGAATPDAAPDATVFVRPDAGEACSATDLDDDGFGTAAVCAARDCDDRNAQVYPGAPEACNGADDDCDGDADEELGSGACGVGACVREAPFCAAGRPGLCTPGAPAAETCNRVDDDCDGTTDEDVAGAPCGTGACARTAQCVDGAMAACVPGPASPEACNRADDDCDGVVDNGFRATVIDGRYSMLQTRHSGCTAGSRIGPDCNAAMNRACAESGCATTGFGPVENSGDVAHYTCVVASEARDVPFSELAQRHAGCDGSRQRIGPDCNAAIHRYCSGLGHVTGFGPAEIGASSMLVQCLGAGVATTLDIGYGDLAAHHGPCNGSTQRIGPDCNAAIHRFCASRGFVSGFGPLENDGPRVSVACLSP